MTNTAESGLSSDAQLTQLVLGGRNFKLLLKQAISGANGLSYILHGTEGMGKGVLAAQFAKAILCEEAQGKAASCGRCESCTGFNAGGGFGYVYWDGRDPNFKENLREIRKAAIKGSFTEKMVIVIEHASAPDPILLDPLLKVLEEQKSIFILTADDIRNVRQTIRSRCMNFQVKPMTRSNALKYILARRDDKQHWDERVVSLLAELAQGRPRKLVELVSHMENQAGSSYDSLIADSELTWPFELAGAWPVILLHGNCQDVMQAFNAANTTIGVARAQSILAFLKYRLSLSGESPYNLDPALKYLDHNSCAAIVLKFQEYALIRDLEINCLCDELAEKWLRAVAC